MATTERGRFIVLEGGEGAGKSTQLGKLAGQLDALGIPVVTTREPGGTPVGERLRAVMLGEGGHGLTPEATTLIIYAARAEHLSQVIRPALAAGKWVLCDRFSASTYAYQGAAEGVSIGFIDALEQEIVGETRPDLTVLLDLPAEIGLARSRSAELGEGRFEAKDIAFHETLRAAFIERARREAARTVIIDASGSETDITEQIWSELAARFAQIPS